MLVASLVIVSCSERPAPQVTTNTDAADAASTDARPARFERAGLSQDLLCPLARSISTPPPDGLAGAPAACDCGFATPGCRVVGTRADRRRSLLLAAGDAPAGDVAIPAGARLRFSAALVGHPADALDLEVVAIDTASGERRTWKRAVGQSDEWVDAELDLNGFVGPTARLQIAVRSDAPLAQARLAFAMPRLVVPASSEGGASNVIVYLIDTLRADHTTPYGYARPTTPRLEALAREGVVFDDAFSVASWTRPAIASLFTGLHPATHGVHTDSGLPDAAATLAERFRAAGWSTAAFVANGHVWGATLNFEQGFDRFVAVRGTGRESARTDAINALLLPHLAQHGDEPFFVYVHAVDPHAPYDPPATHRGRFTDAAYDGAITTADTLQDRLRTQALGPRDVQHVVDLYDEDVRYQDDMLGVLLDHLARTDLQRRTMLVVLADHGEELFEHGGWGHGQRLWEEAVRIPLVIHAPGASKLAGRRVAAPVQITDVMPTLLGWFGVPGRDACQGKDLAGVIDGTATLERPVHFEERRPRAGYELVGLIDHGWKIVRRRPRSDVGPTAPQLAADRLFDLASDPREQDDVAAREPQRLAAMQELLARQESELQPLPGTTDGVLEAPAALVDASTRRQLESLGYVLAEDAGVPSSSESPQAP